MKKICHKCSKGSPEVDLVECSDIGCDCYVCCDCATELEWEMETCSEHALTVFMDLRTMYRDALRRAA